jgi:metal-responsive CopG/Arc/MetJ family transcriptional regulator
MSKSNLKQRTQIYLDKDQYHALHQLSDIQQISASELIRKAIEKFLQKLSFRDSHQDHFLQRIAGMVSTKIKEGSLYHDKYIYGKRT